MSLSSHNTGFFKNSDTRYRSFCVLNIALGSAPIAPQASRKACSFLPVNSFIISLLGVRTPFRSFLLIRTLVRPFGRFGSRDFDRRGVHARPHKQLLREPRRIEILDQEKIPHFKSEVAYYRRFYDPLFSSGRTGQISEDFCHPHGRVAAVDVPVVLVFVVITIVVEVIAVMIPTMLNCRLTR